MLKTKRMIIIATATATLAMPAIAQQMRPQPAGPGVTPLAPPRLASPLRPLHWPPFSCPAGTRRGWGCVQWSPAPPGLLFGVCQSYGWTCVRIPTPIG
jgi:hypothetical protein